MIPKIIHYCWFGGKHLPQKYQKYILGWQKLMPDYKIIQWDESNFDINAIPFSSEAYNIGKYAYVSDYARLKILHEYGGLYLDTDVELIKPLYDILEKGAYMGFEKNSNKQQDEIHNVSVGLGFAVEKGNSVIREALDFYESHHFIYPDGHMEQVTIVKIITDILKRRGLSQSNEPQLIDGITIYPWDYFCPIEFLSYKLEITKNTYSIHHYSASWMSWKDKLKMRRGYYANILRKLIRIK